jgi:hypothetical protein
MASIKFGVRRTPVKAGHPTQLFDALVLVGPKGRDIHECRSLN